MINFSQSGIGHLRKLMLAASIIGLVFVSSCNSSDDTDIKGNWSEVAQMGGAVRAGAISFQLGDQVVVGLGYNGAQTSTGRIYLGDFQSFDGVSWHRNAVPNFPGTLREGAVAFVLNNKVYVGLGYNRDLDYEVLDDFWEYDPATSTWTELTTAKFPEPLYNSIAFVVNGRAFVGTGTDGSIWENTIWEFDPAGLSWKSTTTSIPGKTREGASVFVLNNEAYIIGGSSNGQYELAFWKFNPEAPTQWENITPTDDLDYYDEFKLVAQRKLAVTLVLDNYVYVTTGQYSSALNSCYQYDPSTQIWREMQAFEANARISAVGFVLNGRAFVGTGSNGTSYYSDFWEFKPNEDYDANR